MPRRFVAFTAVFVAASIAMLGTATRLSAHPLHTTLSELSFDEATHVVRVTVRLFADDLTVGLTKRNASLASDHDVLAYAAAALSVTDRGRPIHLESCGVRRASELLWVCLEGRAVGASGDLALRQALLTDAFADQVNIVQVSRARDRRTLLFIRGDREKRLF